MKNAALAALLAAALALPAASQPPTPRGEKSPAAPAAESRQKAEGGATPRERARLARAQNKEMKCATRTKQPKKAPAT